MSDADSDFKQVLFLAHFDGDENGTTFIPIVGPTITRTNFVTKTGTKKFGTASAYAAGNGVLSLVTSGDSRWALGTNDFTIESWIYVASGSSGAREIIDKFSTWSTSVDFVFEVDASGYLRFFCGDNIPVDLTSDSALSTNTWIHVAVSRASNVFRLFVDGVLQADSVTNAVRIANNKTTATIGSNGFGGNYWNGSLDDLRITLKARYTATFTPPSEPFPNYGRVVRPWLPQTVPSPRPPRFPGSGKVNCVVVPSLAVSDRSRGTLSGTITEQLVLARFLVTACDAVTGERYASTLTATGTYALKVPKNKPILVWCAALVEASWMANQAVSGDALIAPSNPSSTPYVYRCTTAGRTGATEPTWGTTLGGTTSDGTAVWTCLARIPPPAIQGPLVAT